MKGSVTIGTDEYDSLKRYEQFYRAEKTVIFENDYQDKIYFAKAEPEKVIKDLQKEIKEQYETINDLRGRMVQLMEKVQNTKQRCRRWCLAFAISFTIISIVINIFS